MYGWHKVGQLGTIKLSGDNGLNTLVNLLLIQDVELFSGSVAENIARFTSFSPIMSLKLLARLVFTI